MPPPRNRPPTARAGAGARAQEASSRRDEGLSGSPTRARAGPHGARVPRSLSFLTRRCKEEGCIPTTPGKTGARRTFAPRAGRTARSGCCAAAGRERKGLRTSESESLLSDSWLRPSGLSSVVGVIEEAEQDGDRLFTREARVGVCCPWAIRGSFRRGFGWPRFTTKPRNTHLGRSLGKSPCQLMTS
jgi:hypothetical protein